jgi:hypothetical protein
MEMGQDVVDNVRILSHYPNSLAAGPPQGKAARGASRNPLPSQNKPPP